MAKVTIAGNAFVITSSVSMADLKMVKQYRSSALVLVDEESKEPYFKVGVGSNSLSDHGICFGGVSNDDAKMATATLSIPADTEDVKTYVVDKTVMAMANLRKVEATVAGVLEEIKTERDAIVESITVSV